MTVLGPGSTVCLNGAEVWTRGGNVRLEVFGLWTLEERELRDPAAYIQESGWWLYRAGDPEYVFIADSTLWEQTDPRGYGAYLAEMREQELHELETA